MTELEKAVVSRAAELLDEMRIELENALEASFWPSQIHYARELSPLLRAVAGNKVKKSKADK